MRLKECILNLLQTGKKEKGVSGYNKGNRFFEISEIYNNLKKSAVDNAIRPDYLPRDPGRKELPYKVRKKYKYMPYLPYDSQERMEQDFGEERVQDSLITNLRRKMQNKDIPSGSVVPEGIGLSPEQLQYLKNRQKYGPSQVKEYQGTHRDLREKSSKKRLRKKAPSVSKITNFLTKVIDILPMPDYDIRSFAAYLYDMAEEGQADDAQGVILLKIISLFLKNSTDIVTRIFAESVYKSLEDTSVNLEYILKRSLCIAILEKGGVEAGKQFVKGAAKASIVDPITSIGDSKMQAVINTLDSTTTPSVFDSIKLWILNALTSLKNKISNFIGSTLAGILNKVINVAANKTRDELKKECDNLKKSAIYIRRKKELIKLSAYLENIGERNESIYALHLCNK